MFRKTKLNFFSANKMDKRRVIELKSIAKDLGFRRYSKLQSAPTKG